jgi:hypothetical protein
MRMTANRDEQGAEAGEVDADTVGQAQDVPVDREPRAAERRVQDRQRPTERRTGVAALGLRLAGRSVAAR